MVAPGPRLAASLVDDEQIVRAGPEGQVPGDDVERRPVEGDDQRLGAPLRGGGAREEREDGGEGERAFADHGQYASCARTYRRLESSAGERPSPPKPTTL